MTKHYYGLEWLRFLMALYMVVYHLGGLYGDAPQLFRQLVGMGFYATSTFFLLSGFLLAHVCLNDEGQMKGSPKGFIARRLCNLYPIHLITLSIALILLFFRESVAEGVLVYYNQHPYAPVEDRSLDEVLPPLGWTAAGAHVVMQFLLLQSWEPRFLWLNGATWSISALLFFYLLFPILGPRLMAARRWLLLGFCVWGLYLLLPLAATWLGAYDYITVGVMHRNPIVRLPEFLIGILLYRAVKEPSIAAWVARYRYLLIVVGLSSLGFGAWLLNEDGKHWFYLVHNGLLTPFQSMLLLACTTFSAPRTASVRQIAQRLGEASLCIFAIHTPLIGLIAPWTRRILTWLDDTGEAASEAVSDVVEDMMSDAMGDAVSDAIVSVTIPLWALIPHLLFIVGLGLIFQRFLIGPIRRWLERRLPNHWQPRRKTAAVGPRPPGESS
ncbi:acyltransferase family protein [Pseudomonas matsuisoli]|uniref:Acyltransferase n=1 Tax=Pseudomonas matsuisoli TaxID=1515666 RepID=A0A917PVZ0_9PSED|nr:acyltransferase [Pseudomonas matsuisoli]GGJ93739.1 acyltransferase [Pseudomonas matsuisoli]